MIWFRQAASHYPSQWWPINVAILRHNVLSNCHIIYGDSRITATFVRGKHLWQVVLAKNQCCRAFLFVLLSAWIICWTNSRVAHDWRCYDANVISLCWLTVIFKNVVRPQWKYSTNVNCLAAQVTLAIILPFKDGKLFMINLSSAMPADNPSTESTRPSASLMSTM